MKVGRDGRPLYVKPVEHVEEQLDLSLWKTTTVYTSCLRAIFEYTCEGTKQPIASNRIHSIDGEQLVYIRTSWGASLRRSARV